jgi:hypothetical protein
MRHDHVSSPVSKIGFLPEFSGDAAKRASTYTYTGRNAKDSEAFLGVLLRVQNGEHIHCCFGDLVSWERGPCIFRCLGDGTESGCSVGLVSLRVSLASPRKSPA